MFKIILFILLVPFVLSAAEFHFPQQVKLKGELEQRVRLTEKRLMHQPFDLDLIVQDVARKPELKRRFEEYEGDVSGRILGCWSYMSRLFDERPEKLDRIFEAILQYQSEEGYFGIDQQSTGWDYWGRQTFGHGRLLGGLIQYYHLSRDERALEAATKLGDYFIKIIPMWTETHSKNPWTNTNPWVRWENPEEDRQHFVKTHMTSILESLVMLYEINPKAEYLEAGKKIVELFPDFGHYHSHSYMNTMAGMAMFYNLTEDHEVLSKLYNLYWQNISVHSNQPDGGMREWFPDDHRTEGCSVTDWIRLNLTMWHITRDAIYIDRAENAWYNALNFHQTANGAFGHAVCSPDGYESTYSEAWWCCTMHGLWAYAELINYSAAAAGDHLWFNFFAPMSFDLEVKDRIIHFDVDTDYPQKGRVVFRATTEDPVATTTHLRLPSWAKDAQIILNGTPQNIAKTRGEFSFKHQWRTNDELILDIPLALRIVDPQGNNLLHRRKLPARPHPAYFYYGPLLLVSQSSGRRGFADEVRVEPGKSYQHTARAESFVLPQAHFLLPAIYDGAVNTVTLSPMSEQTGYATWSDEWVNFIRNGEQPIDRVPVLLKHRVRIVK